MEEKPGGKFSVSSLGLSVKTAQVEMTEKDEWLESIGATGLRDEDCDGRIPLHRAIQDTKGDPKLLHVVMSIIEEMTAEDTTCRSRDPK